MRSEKQKAEARKRCGRLYQKFKDLSWIIDDESIFMLSNSCSNRNSKFYTSNIRLAPKDVRYKKKKFEDHVMLWLCFSEKSCPKPYFLNKGILMNEHNYLKECIKKSVVMHIIIIYFGQIKQEVIKV